MMKLLSFLLLGFFFLTFSGSASAQIFTTEKLITVDLGKRMLYAWEGGQVQHQTPAGIGMRYTPTLRGNFRIYRKVPVQDMKGNYPPYPAYYLRDVPNVMYYSEAYAIHGAYWHNKFGTTVSHGCVNIPVSSSEWLYNWAPIGTPVYIF